MTSTRTALVIGGGIAGPAAAMALRRAGIEATVCEAQPRTADGAGVFLTLASNGLDALRTIGVRPRSEAHRRPPAFREGGADAAARALAEPFHALRRKDR
jgi:2-polyprenyl-6-methoxyphenol hydroxylase-like FAD-dependent oxidoreductase